MTRRKASEKAKSSPEKVSRRTSRRGRKTSTASPERENASGKDLPEEQQEAEEHKSDDSGSEQEAEDVRKSSRARRGSRAKASEEKTTSRPRRTSRRKSQSVEPSDREESEREENGEQDTAAVMDTIPEEKPEEVQEMVVAETTEPKPVEESKEEVTNADPEPETVEKNNHEEEERQVESEQRNEARVDPAEEQAIECTKADICEQSHESGEVDSESVQEDESQQAPSKTEEPPTEATPEKEVSEEESSSEKETRKSEPPKRVRKSRFRSRSKSPAPVETNNETVEMKQNDGDDKNDDELEAGEIKDDEVPKRSPDKKLPEEKPLRRPLQRKRRWLSSKSDTKASVITISTDSLKNIISEPVQPVPLSDVKLESSPEPEEIVDSNEEQSPGERRRSKDKLSLKSSEKENTEEPDHKPKPAEKLLGNRKISIVSDDGNTAIARPPSPAKHHSSNILYITNLVRPFTVLQLKSLLARTGKIVENGFWIDKIKSKCFVKYETEDEAVETRHALHGVRWPASNPKCLHVDFGTETAMEKAIISTLDDAGTTRITIDNSKDGKDFGWSRDAVKHDEVRPVREWDLGKKDTFDREDRDRGAEGDRIGRDRDRERERDRDRDRERDRGGRGDEGRGDRGRRRSVEREFGRGDRERRRGSTSVSPARKFKKKENEPPIRLLDDLFRKTKATPCIYWLPLTVEQMAAREEQRRKDMAENQRRQEEARKQEEERRKERERRERERRERPRSNSRDRRRRSRSRDDGRRRHR